MYQNDLLLSIQYKILSPKNISQLVENVRNKILPQNNIIGIYVYCYLVVLPKVFVHGDMKGELERTLILIHS